MLDSQQVTPVQIHRVRHGEHAYVLNHHIRDKGSSCEAGFNRWLIWKKVTAQIQILLNCQFPLLTVLEYFVYIICIQRLWGMFSLITKKWYGWRCTNFGSFALWHWLSALSQQPLHLEASLHVLMPSPPRKAVHSLTFLLKITLLSCATAFTLIRYYKLKNY